MGGSRHSSTNVQWPGWEQPAAQQFLQAGTNLAMPGGQFQPYDPGMNQQVAPFAPGQQAGLGLIYGNVGGAQGLSDIGAGMLADTLSGRYLNPNSNPYLAGTYQQAAQQMSDAYRYGAAPELMAAAARANALGGSAYNETADRQRYSFGQNLANLANQIYGGNYANERQNMMGAESMVPSAQGTLFAPGQTAFQAGSAEQQQQQALLDAFRQNVTQAVQWPYQVAGNMSSILSGAAGPSSNTIAPTRMGWLK